MEALYPRLSLASQSMLFPYETNVYVDNRGKLATRELVIGYGLSSKILALHVTRVPHLVQSPNSRLNG